MICGTCGRDNPARLTFCEDCGARLSPRSAAPTPPAGVPRAAVDSVPAAKRPSAPELHFASDAPPSSPPTSAGMRPAAPMLRTPEKQHAVEVGVLAEAAAAAIDAVPIRALGALDAPTMPVPRAELTKSRMCTRCHGMSDASIPFCRFCGAPMSDDAAPAPPPAEVAAPGPAALVLSIGQDGKASASFELVERLDIGRSEGDVVIAWDPYLSARHLRLEARGGALYARDLGTPNGVYLRIRNAPREAAANASAKAKRPGAVPLQDQDLILLGQQVIRFEVVKDAEAGFGPATQHGTALFGTPAGPVYARLCQRTVEGVTRDVFHVRKDEVVLGRELGDVVFTDDAFLSRRHAVVRRDAESGEFSLADAGSSNGTFLRIRGEVALQNGDELRIGQQLFRIEPPAGVAGSAGSTGFAASPRGIS